MEAVLTLAQGDAGARAVGAQDFFEGFYDQIPHRGDGPMRENSAILAEERAALIELSRLMDAACDATPKHVRLEELLASGWPQRIQPVAQKALAIMARRGRFSERQEEDEPSETGPWPIR
jgi:hypothetical protein